MSGGAGAPGAGDATQEGRVETLSRGPACGDGTVEARALAESVIVLPASTGSEATRRSPTDGPQFPMT